MFPMFLAPEAASAAASLPTNPVLAAVVAVAAAAADAVMSSDDNGDDNSNDDNGDESEAGDAASISPGDLSTAEYRVGLKKNLETELDNITTRGSFAAFAKLPELHPDLFVNDVGPVSLPLREAQAYQIIEKARQAPYGRGSETIVNTSVRNTWKLYPTQFQIRNPDWAKTEKIATKFVANKLGITQLMTAELS